MGRLDGKVVFITGAAAGLGRVAAELFAAEGARVAAVDRADAGPTVEAIAASGGEAVAVACDVTDGTSVQDAIAGTVAEFGAVHVLYNNAGVSLAADGDTVTTDEATWDVTMDVNVKGVWLCCKHGVPALRDSGGGSIVNVASFVAHMGAATPQLAYTTSKGAVVAMTREVAVTHAREGIRANALCPGPVLTPLLAKYMEDDAARRRRLVHIPMGRFGEAVEVARAALFLASDESSFMTGQSLIVDGGITAAYTTPE